MRLRRTTFKDTEALIKGLSWDASLTGLSWDSKHRGLSWDSTVEEAALPTPTRGLSWDASVEVAALLQALRDEATVPLPDARVERLARLAVTEVRDAPARLTPLRQSRWALVRRRVATLGTSLVLALGSTAGVAVAANQAIPGDQLYGLDQALERVGIGAGGSAERLGEALELVQRGDVAGGLQHAAESVAGAAADSEAAEALRAAAERLLEQRENPSDDVRAQVAALLEFLADAEGQVDGRAVSDIAGDIGNAPTEPPGEGEPPTEPPGQGEPPTEPPGQGEPPTEPPGRGEPPSPPGQGDDN